MSTVEMVGQAVPVVQALDDAPRGWFFGGEAKMRTTSEETGGQLAIIEQYCAPGLASPYHVHHNEDEEFYIIEGQLRFVSEGKSWVGGPGTFAFLPRNIPHGFEIVGETPARFLLMVTPGGFENFAMELWTSEPAPPDMGKVMEATPRYGLEIFGPLPE